MHQVHACVDCDCNGALLIHTHCLRCAHITFTNPEPIPPTFPAGFLPFDEPHMSALFRKIQKAEFTYPSWFTPEVRACVHACEHVHGARGEPPGRSCAYWELYCSSTGTCARQRVLC